MAVRSYIQLNSNFSRLGSKAAKEFKRTIRINCPKLIKVVDPRAMVIRMPPRVEWKV
jgi:hypothetical protein